MKLLWRNSASEMFVNLIIRSFDETLRIFTFGFMSRVIVSIMCLYLVFTTHSVVCIPICGLGGIVYYSQKGLIYKQHT